MNYFVKLKKKIQNYFREKIKPEKMLKNVIIIFTCLKDDDEFCEFIVQDQHYFNLKILNEILICVNFKNLLNYD